MPDIPFCPNGIAKLVDSLKLISSCEIDGINAKILKNMKSNVSTILCHTFEQDEEWCRKIREWARLFQSLKKVRHLCATVIAPFHLLVFVLS